MSPEPHCTVTVEWDDGETASTASFTNYRPQNDEVAWTAAVVLGKAGVVNSVSTLARFVLASLDCDDFIVLDNRDHRNLDAAVDWAEGILGRRRKKKNKESE